MAIFARIALFVKKKRLNKPCPEAELTVFLRFDFLDINFEPIFSRGVMSLSHISIVNPVEVKMKESKRGSLYEAIVAMGLRARQVNDQIKQQLQARMADVITDGDESEGTNFDQLAISREFDNIAKPTFIAMREMFDDKVKYEMPVEVKPEED